MAVDLAGSKHGVAERFVPDTMEGTLLEAEHLARYRWAAGLASGRRVLDAGCGTGYGSSLLAAAGAADVVGIDTAGDVLRSVEPHISEGVRLEVADVSQLPYADGAFDLVVCFDVVEHLEDPGPAFDELVRVLDSDGVLLLSTPNPAVHSPPSPHHRHEFRPDELAEQLQARLSHVRMMRQAVYLTVAVLGDADFLTGGRTLRGITLDKIATEKRGCEEFTLAVATRAELPEVPPLALMTSSLQVKRWLTAFAEQRAMAAVDHARIVELEEMTKDVAKVAHLESRVGVLDNEVARVRKDNEALIERAEHAERVLREVWTSLSWRLTSPLRRLKSLVGSRTR